MNLALLAFLVSVVVSLLSFTLIASWYVVPRLSKQPYVQALLPLVLLNVFRVEGFVFLLPQVMGGTLSVLLCRLHCLWRCLHGPLSFADCPRATASARVGPPACLAT